MRVVMSQPLRKLALTIHILVSVGWVGAVTAYLALALVGWQGDCEQLVRASYLMMEVTALYVIVPLAVASFLTGIVMAVGTRWGLFRHYWVTFSFLLTVVAILVLFGQLGPISNGADRAQDPSIPPDELYGAGGQVLHAAFGLLVLCVIAGLNVFKPSGLTPYGWRKVRDERAGNQ